MTPQSQLKTDRDEMMLLTFDSVADSLQALSRLVSDRPDIGDLLDTPGR